jgi:hypothetical protein
MFAPAYGLALTPNAILPVYACACNCLCARYSTSRIVFTSRRLYLPVMDDVVGEVLPDQVMQRSVAVLRHRIRARYRDP